MNDLRSADTHFAFGRNWASYAEGIGEGQIARAILALERLSGRKSLAGLSFLDIGCGSGVHCLAAIRMGAARVVAVDIDQDSVETTRAVLGKFAPGADVTVRRLSVFDLDTAGLGTFDVVYSWGVLHHSGDMVSALAKAAGAVAAGGMFLFALYRETYLCGFWRVEKKWYASASPDAQKRAQRLFVAWFRGLTRVRGGANGRTTFDAYVKDYSERGMDFHHDIHDWLGGYPYESVLPDAVDGLMKSAGLRLDSSFLCRPSRGKSHGLLGSGCDEYRYVRP